MLENLYRKLEPKASWAIFTILFYALLISGPLFTMRQAALGEGEYVKTLDGRLFLYGSTDVKNLFGNLKNVKPEKLAFLANDKLNLYAITEVTLDFTFPFIYCFLIIILIIRLYSAETAKYLILLPVIMGISDLCENTTIALMAVTFDGNSSSFAYLAASFTAIKLILLIICALIVVPVGVIISIKKQKAQKEI